MQLPRVDVVTVGAGWTGGILAEQLTRAGLSVVSLEQGELRDTADDFSHNHDELRYQVRRDMMVDLANETWTWRPTPGDTALPMRQYGSFNPGKGVGGAGVHWAAQHWRFYPSDFQYRTHHIDRYGTRPLAGREPDPGLAGDVRRDGEVLRRGRLRHRRLGQGGQPEWGADRGWQHLRRSARPRVPFAATHVVDRGGQVRRGCRRSRLSPLPATVGHPLRSL